MPTCLSLEIIATWRKARVTRLKLPHYTCDTPMFMPVGTQATVRLLLISIHKKNDFL